MAMADNGWQRRAETARRTVDETVCALPEDVRRHAEALALELETVPPKALRREGFPRDLLGLFSGRSLRDPQDNALREPTVTLFLDNLWSFAEHDWDLYEEEVRTTYLHELGHYLGLDEADLAERELE